MEKLKVESAIVVAGASHGAQSVKDIGTQIEKARSFFFKKEQDGKTPGTNLYYLEFVNMSNEQKEAFLSLSKEHPLLEAYLQSLELWKNGFKSPKPKHKLDQDIQQFMSTPVEERNYLYQEFFLLEGLRTNIDLKVDTESYPEKIAQQNYDRGQEFIYHRDCAVDFLLMGRKFIHDYLTALKLEATLSRERHNMISKAIAAAISTAEANAEAIRIYILFGTGHVPGLSRTIKSALNKIAPDIPVIPSYEHGKLYLHRYDLIAKMETDPKYTPDVKNLTMALIDEMFDGIPELQKHPLVASLTGSQKRQLIYNSLAKCNQKDIDRILKGMVSGGPEQGLVKLLGH